jgi:hypothetical protein
MRTWLGMLLCTGSLLAVACSGGIKHKVDDTVLSDVPLQDKQGMLNAKAHMDRVAEERNLAVSNRDTAKRDLDIAKASREQAMLEVDKDQSLFDLAQKQKNQDAMRDAQDRLRVSQLAVSAADARINWQQQLAKVDDAALKEADAHQRLAAARYELEKARLAQRENKRPSKNFTVDEFERQAADHDIKYRAAQVQTQAQQDQAERLRNLYTELAQQYNKQRTQVPGPAPTIFFPLPQTATRSNPHG